MSNIKFGLKLWSININYDLFDDVKKIINDGIFDYIELMPIPGSDISVFLKEKLPYIIHAPHESFGLNTADRKKEELNLKMINESIEWADRLSAKYLILHPGFGKMETAIKFLEKINDKRILIENMPKIGINDEQMLGHTVEQIRKLTGNKFGFCLDFGHAIKAALSMGIDYRQYVEELLSLNPRVFHICDGTLNPGKDEHFDIGKGEYDFKFLLDCIKGSDSKLATLETPRNNLNSFKEDLENIKNLKINI